jgi:hypothetical protein
MAYQNFFCKADNTSRQNPAQVSGKNLYTEFRMRKEGESALVVDCAGYPDSQEKDKIIVRVTVYNPATGQQVFCEQFKTKK